MSDASSCPESAQPRMAPKLDDRTMTPQGERWQGDEVTELSAMIGI